MTLFLLFRHIHLLKLAPLAKACFSLGTMRDCWRGIVGGALDNLALARYIQGQRNLFTFGSRGCVRASGKKKRCCTVHNLCKGGGTLHVCAERGAKRSKKRGGGIFLLWNLPSVDGEKHVWLSVACTRGWVA